MRRNCTFNGSVNKMERTICSVVHQKVQAAAKGSNAACGTACAPALGCGLWQRGGGGLVGKWDPGQLSIATLGYVGEGVNAL